MIEDVDGIDDTVDAEIDVDAGDGTNFDVDDRVDDELDVSGGS